MSFCKSMHFYEKNTKHTTNLINTLFPKVCIFTTKTFYMSLISCHKLVHVPPHFLSQFMSTRAREDPHACHRLVHVPPHTLLYIHLHVLHALYALRVHVCTLNARATHCIIPLFYHINTMSCHDYDHVVLLCPFVRTILRTVSTVLPMCCSKDPNDVHM